MEYRTSSLEDLHKVVGLDRPLPMEQDADADSETSILESMQVVESKDGLSIARLTKHKNSAGAVTSPPGAANSKTLVGYAAKLTGMSAAAAPAHKKSSGASKGNVGSVTTEYGFRYTNPSGELLVYIVLYKTEKCSRKPCARTCEKYHSVKERRRNPLQFEYSEQPCPNVKSGNSTKTWGDPSKCPEGDLCPCSHTLLEQMYHPNIYKTGMCNKFSPDPASNACSWGPLCTHAHGPQDRDKQVRALSKYRELFAAGVTDWTNDSAEILGSAERRSNGSAPAASNGSRSILDLHLKVEDEDKPSSAVSDDDPILRTPVDASPAYDATLNRQAGAPFLSSFSNVSVPATKPSVERAASLSDRSPIGPAKSKPMHKQEVSSSPLTQAMKLSTLPLVSPSNQESANKASLMLTRALSGPSRSSGLASPAPQPTGTMQFPTLNRPASTTMISTNGVFDRQSGDASGIWGNYSLRTSWDLADSSADQRVMLMASSKTSIGGKDDEEFKVQFERLQARVICPQCCVEDRSAVLLPCRHFLCSKCADDSSTKKKCLHCDQDCESSIIVRL